MQKRVLVQRLENFRLDVVLVMFPRFPPKVRLASEATGMTTGAEDQLTKYLQGGERFDTKY